MKKPKTEYDILKSIRGTWGNVNPVTKVIDSKKVYTRKKKT
jgi:hypothetical protein